LDNDFGEIRKRKQEKVKYSSFNEQEFQSNKKKKRDSTGTLKKKKFRKESLPKFDKKILDDMNIKGRDTLKKKFGNTGTMKKRKSTIGKSNLIDRDVPVRFTKPNSEDPWLETSLDQSEDLDIERLINLLKELEEIEIFDKENESTYKFKQLMFQQVAKEILLYTKRKLIHKLVAEWYERNEEKINSIYSILAYHYKHAEQKEKYENYYLLAQTKVHFHSQEEDDE